jgi:LPXTG-motif cell wall-anchored protein
MTRVLLGLAGAAAAVYGALLLLDRGPEDLVDLAMWLVAGVVLHDLVLAPVTILVVVVASRLLPAVWWPAAAALLVVLGSVTLLAIPVLGRFGARADNPTLLDRPYWTGWALIAGLTLLAAAAATLVRRRRQRRPLRAVSER